MSSDESENKSSTPEFSKMAILNSWDTKAHAQPTLPGDLGIGVLLLFCFLAVIGSFLLGEDDDFRDLLFEIGIIGSGFYSYMWFFAIRQQTLYKYRVYQKGAEVDYSLFYPKFANFLFKGIAIFVVVCLLAMLSVAPWLMLGAIIPATLLVIAAMNLFNWENPVEHHSTDWARYDLVFIDHKRKMVVASFQDYPLSGFEVHLEKDKIDEFVAFLKTVIPNAEFREAKWEW